MIMLLPNSTKVTFMEQGYGREHYKVAAINALHTWLNAQPLEHFEDPKRAGTSRGEKIGMGRSKIVAAGLLSLYPKLSLQEISKIAGVSYGLLRKWKTEEDFKDKMQQLANDFGIDMARCVVAVNVEEYLFGHKAGPDLSWTEIGDEILILKSQEPLFKSFLKSPKSKEMKKKKVFIIDDGPSRWTKHYQQKYSSVAISENVMPLLLWYGLGVVDAFSKYIKSHMHIPGVAESLTMLSRASFLWEDYDEARVKSWMTQPVMLDWWEASIASTVNWLTDRLADPNPRNHTDNEKIKEKELAGLLQIHIRAIFNLLRNKT
jgi:hypothetical protein